MAAGDAARLYHRLTSSRYGTGLEWPEPGRPVPVGDPRMVADFVPLDMARLPAPCKAYPPGLPVVHLPRDWGPVPGSATSVLAGQHVAPPTDLDLPGLARLLHLSAGVVRVMERADRRWLFRAAGSAGGRFPLEVYLSSRGVAGLSDGVHWYDPIVHGLIQVGPPAAGGATTLIVTGVPWRTGWKYAERGLRHVYWDAGTMLAQTLALADSGGFQPRLWTRFADAEVTRLVGADGIHEFPLALVGLGDGEPAIRAASAAIRGAIDAAPTEFPLVTRTQHAGDGDRLGEPWAVGPPLPDPAPGTDDLDTVILRRGSTRVMDASASMPRAVVDWSLAASLRGSRVPHFVAVHAVEGLAPGLYRWPDLDRPLRRGSLREEAFLVCFEQELCRDACFVAMAAMDLADLDDCGYREAQIDAGIVEGRLHLAAFALGFGASGMTILDSELEHLLDEPLAGLLFTCVGRPTYRNKAGGRPGEPVMIGIPPSA